MPIPGWVVSKLSLMSWIAKNKDSVISVWNTWCNLCYKVIDIAAEGVSALNSHAE